MDLQRQQQMYKYLHRYRIMNMLLLKQSNLKHKQLQLVMHYMLKHQLGMQNIILKLKHIMKHIILMLSMIQQQNNLLQMFHIIRSQFQFKPNQTYKMQLLLQQLLMSRIIIQHYKRLYIRAQLYLRNSPQQQQHLLQQNQGKYNLMVINLIHKLNQLMQWQNHLLMHYTNYKYYQHQYQQNLQDYNQYYKQQFQLLQL